MKQMIFCGCATEAKQLAAAHGGYAYTKPDHLFCGENQVLFVSPAMIEGWRLEGYLITFTASFVRRFADRPEYLEQAAARGYAA